MSEQFIHKWKEVETGEEIKIEYDDTFYIIKVHKPDIDIWSDVTEDEDYVQYALSQFLIVAKENMNLRIERIGFREFIDRYSKEIENIIELAKYLLAFGHKNEEDCEGFPDCKGYDCHRMGDCLPEAFLGLQKAIDEYEKNYE